jgi:hypothetical protein
MDAGLPEITGTLSSVNLRKERLIRYLRPAIQDAQMRATDLRRVPLTDGTWKETIPGRNIIRSIRFGFENPRRETQSSILS